jgi:hypothetical protein
MWTVLIIERTECCSVGWPSAVDESTVRLLLPCPSVFYSGETPGLTDNPTIWSNDDDNISPFAWMCRMGVLGVSSRCTSALGQGWTFSLSSFLLLFSPGL